MGKYVSLVVLFFLLTACSDQTDEQEVNEPPIRAVKLYTVQDSDRANSRVLVGKVIASKTADLSFPMSGKVLTVEVEIGDRVNAGDTLAKLDTTDLIQAKKSAQANLTQAKAQHQTKKADFDRKKVLVDKGLITLSELDTAQSNMTSAKSQLTIAEADLRDVNNQLSDTLLTAPFDGVIANKMVEAFMEVTAGQSIFSIEVDNERHQVEFGVPEMIISSVERGMTVDVKLGKNERVINGVIDEISPTADVGNVFKVKATLDEMAQDIKSGLAAEVTLSLKNEKALAGVLIPVTAIMAGLDQKIFVYSYDADTQRLAKRQVEKANQIIGNQVLVSGLTEGDQIVSAGLPFVSDGLKVKPYISKH